MDGETLERCCLEMEEALSSLYRQSRVADCSIGLLEIRVVLPGHHLQGEGGGGEEDGISLPVLAAGKDDCPGN